MSTFVSTINMTRPLAKERSASNSTTIPKRKRDSSTDKLVIKEEIFCFLKYYVTQGTALLY